MFNPEILATSYDALMNDKGLLMTVVTIAGILIVFFALIILIVLISAFGKITGGKGKKQQSAAQLVAEPSRSAIAPPVVEEGISDEIIAVIAAAVASLEGSENFAVRSVRRASVQKSRPAWNAAGIMEQSRTF